jgi:hypothetical protein
VKYQVTYEATYYVEANDEDHAIDLAVEQHSENPDGSWEAVRDPYASPLEQLADGTYSITEAHSVPTLVFRDTGYWVGTQAVLSLSDVPQDGFLGVWTDSVGTRFYDLTRHIEDLNEALAVASYYGQHKIWDILANKEVPVI